MPHERLVAQPAPGLGASGGRRLDGPLAGHVLGDHGPLVVALHGLAESGRYWRPALETLARENRVVVVDLLGFGHSPWPEGLYTAEAHAWAVNATLEQAGLAQEPAVLLAHQAGAAVAVAYARRHPGAVKAVVGLGTPWFRSPSEAARALRGPWWLSRWLVEHSDRARILCRAVCGGRSRVVPWLARWFAPGDVPDEVVEDAFLHTWTSFSQTLRACLLEADLPSALGGDFPVPIIALHGEDDSLVPIENLLDAAVSRPALTVRALPGHGHNLAWTVPALVGATVREAGERRLGSRSQFVPLPQRPGRPAADRSLPAIVAPAAEHTVPEAARLVRVSRRAVLDWVEAGRVRSRRQGGRVLVERASLLEHVFGSVERGRVLLSKPWLSSAEAAARLGVGHATLARHVAAGMPSHRAAGRRVFITDEIDHWIAGRGRRR